MRDLSVLTATKLAVILLIYAVLFAPFASRPDDTAAHLLGVLHQTTPEGS